MNANEASTTAKRVAGGIVIGGKKKPKKRKLAAAGASTSSSSVPSILKSVPSQIANHEATSSPPNVAAAADNDDEFSELLMSNNDEIPSDTLLCLQSYTQSTMGMTAESCAYCPIFANNKSEGGQINKVCTHLAPFLPKCVLLHILDTDSSLSSSSSRMQIEQEIKTLASENKIRLLQLHGTAITTTDAKPSSSAVFKTSKATTTKFSNNGVTGLRGDGNDDDDIAVMETLAFEIAVKMALQSHASILGQEERPTFDTATIHYWFMKQLLPQFAGKTWISSSNLNSFIQANKVKDYWSVDRMSKLVHELTLAGLFLPRRGLGGSRMEGYWFSLPGLGKVSKSIADGRVSILRKLKSCKYQEKKRAILEREHGLFRDGSEDSSKTSSLGTMKKTRSMQQSGKFVVLDLLAKGLVVLKTTSAGEHFIALPKD